jgi:hypothetical protein
VPAYHAHWLLYSATPQDAGHAVPLGQSPQLLVRWE